MVTVTKLIRNIGGKELVEIACLSTDSKPTDVANGSMAMEINTGDIYAFNETATTWVKL